MFFQDEERHDRILPQMNHDLSDVLQNTILVHENDQDEVDVILDKISKSGYSSLTKEEKEKLFKLSNKK